MKAYGVPRVKDVERPDCADLFNYALKSSKGRLREKSGDYKSNIRNPEVKARHRRYWKSKARTANKKACCLEQ